MVKKYLSLTLLATAFVLLLVFLSRRYFVATPSTWVNYQNKQSGVEFSYPKDEPLIKHRNFNDANSSFELRNLETINPFENLGQFSISGRVVSSITTPTELLQSSTDPNSAKLLDNPNLVYGFIGDPPYSAYFSYFPLSDNKYYEVAVRFSFIEQEKVIPLAKKILSTFKINPVTSSWKTYQNEKYGFEINYPSDWIVSENNSLKAIALMTVTIISPYQNTLLDIWVRNGSWSDVQKELGQKSSVVNINGIEALFNYENTYSFASKNPNQIIQILYGKSSSSTNEEKTSLDQILNSFKFTK